MSSGAGDGAREPDDGEGSYGSSDDRDEEAVAALSDGDDSDDEEHDPAVRAHILRQLMVMLHAGGGVTVGRGGGLGGLLRRFGIDESELEESDEEPDAAADPATGRHSYEFEQAEALRESDFAHSVHRAAGDAPHPRPTATGVRRRRASSIGSRSAASDSDVGPTDEAAGAAAAVGSPRASSLSPRAEPPTGGLGVPGSPRVPGRAVNVSRTRHNVANLLSMREAGDNGRVGWRSPERVSVSQRVLPDTLHRSLMRDVATRVYSGQFSADGSLFLGATQADVLRLYDTTTWETLKTIETQDVRWTVSSTDFSPDNQFVVYSTLSDTLHLCNVFGEFEIHEPLEVDTAHSAIYSAQFSAGGTEVACGSSRTLSVFDVERKVTVDRVQAHTDDINSVCYVDLAHRPYLMATGSDDTLVKVWDRRTLGSGRPAGVLPGHSEGITKVSSKGDGLHLLSNGKDQTARLWDCRRMYSAGDAAKLAPVRSRFQWDYRWGNYPGWGRPYKHPHDKSILIYRGHQVISTLIRCYFSPAATTGQRYVYSGSADGAVYIYDALTAAVVAKLDGHRSLVRDVSWHPYEPVLCSSSFDGSIGVWDHRGAIDDERAIRAEMFPDGLAGFAYRRAADSDDDGDGGAAAGGAGGDGGTDGAGGTEGVGGAAAAPTSRAAASRIWE